MSTKKAQGGFIALMSVIILSLTLLFLVVSLGSRSIYGRLALLNFEQKEESESLAESCVAIARLNIANDPLYAVAADKTIAVGTKSCVIHRVTISGSQSTIKTCAKSGNAITNYSVVITTATDAVVSWDEVVTNGCTF